jgi:hypothetical protein
LIPGFVVRRKGTLLINLGSLHRVAVGQRQLDGSLERQLLGCDDSAERNQKHSKKKQNGKT